MVSIFINGVTKYHKKEEVLFRAKYREKSTNAAHPKCQAPDSEEDLCVEDDQGNKWDHTGEEKPRPVCVISRRVEEISRNGENMY